MIVRDFSVFLRRTVLAGSGGVPGSAVGLSFSWKRLLYMFLLEGLNEVKILSIKYVYPPLKMSGCSEGASGREAQCLLCKAYSAFWR